jgi:hypothetical protein
MIKIAHVLPPEVRRQGSVWACRPISRVDQLTSARWGIHAPHVVSVCPLPQPPGQAGPGLFHSDRWRVLLGPVPAIPIEQVDGVPGLRQRHIPPHAASAGDQRETQRVVESGRARYFSTAMMSRSSCRPLRMIPKIPYVGPKPPLATSV